MSEECKSAEATTRVAAARAEDQARLAASRRLMADTSSTGAERSPAAPQVEVGLTSADLARKVAQIEVELSRFNGAIDLKVDELTASVCSMRDWVVACAAQSAHPEIASQQFVDNHADGVLTSRDDGDAGQKRLRQKT